mmetsp:Transcript_54/g.82  ORF Transcript_54/g.82 Transcript_54/m.82 type:complete len:334 (-) Transcript_54:188-1189(-)
MMHARAGNFDAAIPQITTAYLLDGRSIKFIAKLPDNIDEKSKIILLNGELLSTLIHHDTTTFGADILHIILAMYLGSVPGHGQQLIAVAMVRIDNLVSYIEGHPEIEAPDCPVLGGCLTRKALLYQKCSLRMSLGDIKGAMKDLTKALKIDEFYTQARESRACIWASRNLKDDGTVHAEFSRIISEHHVDDRGNEVAYAFLAITTLGDPSLGTFRDAKAWYDKMLAASKRRDEIYGKRREDELPPTVRKAQGKFQDGGNFEILNSIPGVEIVTMRGKTTKRICLKCGAKTRADGGKLSKCIKCKSASYCSRECQVEDWKEHKQLCKILNKELK